MNNKHLRQQIIISAVQLLELPICILMISVNVVILILLVLEPTEMSYVARGRLRKSDLAIDVNIRL